MPRKKPAKAPEAPATPSEPGCALVLAPPGQRLIRRDRANGGRIHVCPNGIKQIESDARNGLDYVSIANRLGMGKDALRSCAKRQPEVAEALETGHAALSDELVHILLKQARSGVTVAAIYLSKARCGWREGEAPQVLVQVNSEAPAQTLTSGQMRSRLDDLLAQRKQLIDVKDPSDG